MTARTLTGRRPFAAALCAVALLAGCGDEADSSATPTSAPTESTATTSTTAATSTEPEAAVLQITWESCPRGGGECATVGVPLDHDDPSGASIDLLVKRRPATGERIGSLFFNFGGPGASTVDLIDGFAIPAEVRERFDLVAMDPRGVGGSTPLDCGIDAVELYSVDPTIEDAADRRALLDVSRRYADDCEDRRGELLAHLGTRDVARDMDLVRAGMGDEQLSYVGYSYGTSIGQAYADLFPERVRAMVLDGVVDPAASGVDAAATQAEGFETALANWAAACPGRSTCPGGDPLGAVDRMLQAAERTVPSSGGARPLGPGEAAVGLAMPLYQQPLWPVLDRAVSSALDGDGAGMVALADEYAGLVDFSIYFAVSCLDSEWPRSVDEFLDRAEAAGRASPRFGEAIVNDYVRCAVWPVDPDPIGAVTAPDTPPILVVSTTGDPATPYQAGVDVADRLESGVLLSFEGEGHTVVFQGSGCVDDVAVAYLVDLAAPAEGARC